MMFSTGVSLLFAVACIITAVSLMRGKAGVFSDSRIPIPIKFFNRISAHQRITY